MTKCACGKDLFDEKKIMEDLGFNSISKVNLSNLSQRVGIFKTHFVKCECGLTNIFILENISEIN